MTVQLTYDSSARSDYLELKSPYYNAIETSEVTFEKEGVVAYADSLGHIEFFDMQKNSLDFVDLPVSKDPSETGHTAQYGDMKCDIWLGRQLSSLRRRIRSLVKIYRSLVQREIRFIN